MARITSQDCLKQIPNHFDLVLIAALRAKGIINGAPTLLGDDYNKHKPEKATVISLREIGEERLNVSTVEGYRAWEEETQAQQTKAANEQDDMQSRLSASLDPSPALAALQKKSPL